MSRHGGPGLFFFLLVGAPLPHASASRRESVRPTALPTLESSTPRPWRLGAQHPLYMTLSFPIWAHFLLPGCSCLSLLLCFPSPIPLSTSLHLGWSALVPVTFWSSFPVHSLTIQTTLICKAAEHFHSLTSQSTCSLDTCVRPILSENQTLLSHTPSIVKQSQHPSGKELFSV